MKFTRGKRIALEILGPPAIGATLMIAIFGVVGAWETGRQGGLLPWFKQVGEMAVLVFAFAYILAGVQSLLYAFIMEWSFAHGLDPRRWRAVGLSSGLGFVSGAVIVMVLGSHGVRWQAALWLYYGGIGLLVGFVLGLLIRRLSR